jgi:hypothetical protein
MASQNASMKKNANSSMFNSSKQPVNANAKQTTTSKLTDQVLTFIKGKGTIIFLLVIIVLLFVLVILYIVFQIKNSKLVGKLLVSKPIKLDELSAPKEIKNGDIPTLLVGREFSFSFWIYLDNYSQSITQTTDPYVNNGRDKLAQDKMIFYRGAAGNIAGANPIVFMDGISNKLYIAIKTQESTLTDSSIVKYETNLAYIRYYNYFMNHALESLDLSNPNHASINRHLILTVDYVPLQRWVNITFIVDNKICTTFLDGEIYSVKSSEEFKSLRPRERDPVTNQLHDYNVIVDKVDGNIYIGKNKVGGNITPPAFFNKLQFYNYALSLDEVKKVYASGPLATGFSIFGNTSLMSGYGVRAPLYKLDEVE